MGLIIFVHVLFSSLDLSKLVFDVTQPSRGKLSVLVPCLLKTIEENVVGYKAKGNKKFGQYKCQTSGMM
jgi:hypothetical protein